MGKGELTRQAILSVALEAANTEGLEQVTIGRLAKDMGMSKSGVFAHFKSKEQLQIALIEEVASRFVTAVVLPALKMPRGEPRVRALFDNWFDWARTMPGGCFFLAVATEVDDRPGPVRDMVVHTQKDWLGALSTAARIAVEEGHFHPDLDTEMFAFEAKGVFFAYHVFHRLLRAERAEQLLRASFEGLIKRSRK